MRFYEKNNNKNSPLGATKRCEASLVPRKALLFWNQKPENGFCVPKMLCIFVIHGLMSELPKRSSEHTQKSQRISDEPVVLRSSLLTGKFLEHENPLDFQFQKWHSHFSEQRNSERNFLFQKGKKPFSESKWRTNVRTFQRKF